MPFFTHFISSPQNLGADGRTPGRGECPQQAQGAQRREAPGDEEDLDRCHQGLAGGLINVHQPLPFHVTISNASSLRQVYDD